MDYFRYRNNNLYCEQVRLSKLAEDLGTPLYVYSQRTFTEHFDKLKKAFSSLDPLICYSVKANSNLALLRILVNRGSGLDIVSGGELYRARLVNCRAKKIVYASVGKTDQEIKDAIDKGILLFNIESVSELERVAQIAFSLGKVQDAALRVNPDVEALTHKYIATGEKKAKFGLDLNTAAVVFRQRERYKGINLNGVHIHIGSQITQPGPFVKAIKKMREFILLLKKEGIDLDYFDIGGGLGIVYGDESPQTADSFARQVIPLLGDLSLKVILEPGRFIIGNAGVLLTKVLYIKQSYRKRFVIVDAGMNDLMRPSLYQAYHSILPVKKPSQLKDCSGVMADVVGPICETGDFLGKKRDLQVKQGDYLSVMSAGAYGFSMSSNYNSRPRPAEVLVRGDKYCLIRQRETYSDLVRKENRNGVL